MPAYLLEDTIKLQGLVNGLGGVFMVEVDEEVWGCLAHHARLPLYLRCPAPGVTAEPAASGRPGAVAVNYRSADSATRRKYYIYKNIIYTRRIIWFVRWASPIYLSSNPALIHWRKNASSICPGPVRSSRHSLVSGSEPGMTQGCGFVFPRRHLTHQLTVCFMHKNAHIYRIRVSTGEATQP